MCMGLGVLEERVCVWAYGVALYCACHWLTCVPLFLLSWNESGTWDERKRSCGCAERHAWWWCQRSIRLGDVLKDSRGEVWFLTLKVTSYTRDAVPSVERKKQKHFASTYNIIQYLNPCMSQTMYTQWSHLLTATIVKHLWTKRTIFHCFLSSVTNDTIRHSNINYVLLGLLMSQKM